MASLHEISFHPALVLTGHNSPIYAMAFNAEQNTLYSAGSGGILAAWPNLNEMGQALAMADAAIFSLQAWANENFLFAGDANGFLYLISTNGKTRARKIKAHEKGVFSIVLDENQNLLVTGGGDGTVAVWKLAELELKFRITISPNTKIRSIQKSLFSLGNYLISCGTGHLYDFSSDTLKFRTVIEASDASLNAFVQDNLRNTIITGGQDAHLRLWKYTSQQWELIKEVPAHNFAIYAINCILIDNEPLLISTSRDKTIKIFTLDLDFIQRLGTPVLKTAHMRSVNALTLLNYDQFASAGDDGRIIIWERYHPIFT